MKNALLIIAGLFISLTTIAQNTTEQFIEASGKTIKDKRAIPDFDKLKVDGSFKVLIGTNDKFIIIEGSDNIVPLITTDVKDGLLTVSLKDGMKFKPSKNIAITIRIPFKVLNEISLYGSGNITSNKKITNKIALKLNGSGSMILNLYSPKTDATLVGCGNITVSGFSDIFNCKVTGSGSIKAIALESDVVNANLSGSGSVAVISNEAITGRINGSGSIAFSGEPKQQDLERIGNGKFSTL